ncbi:MAG: DUF2723 domain-containing protein [Phycisphaerae bacterium]|jgi:hypothetical protein|nr:DUF2723 domain-containing protein [Phycisphaerae bacterium]
MALSESNKIDPAPGASIARTWCLCVLVFSLFYALTCQRGVSWQDSGMYQWRVIDGQYVGQRGLALGHPLYIGAAQILKYIPIGSLAGRLNFFSGLGMAVALANLTATLMLLTGRRWIGLLTVSTLATAHTVWWLSTVAEVYTWSAAGLTAELWLLVILVRGPSLRPLAGLALVSGLGLSLHNFALLPLPIYLVLVIVLVFRRRLSGRLLAVAGLAWLAGASLYLGFVIHHALAGGDVVDTMRSALFGRYAAQVLNTSSLSQNFKANMALSALNFISMLGPLAIVGWFGMRRKLGLTLAVTLGAVTVIEVLFFIRYSVPDQFTFILPTLVTVALAAGIGLSILADMSRRVRTCAVSLCVASLAAQPVFYAAGPSLLRAAGVRVSRGRRLPFRDEMRYWLVPWKQNEDSAERFSVSALAQCRPGSVILADSTSVYPLLVTRNGNDEYEDVQVSEFNRLLPSYDDDPQGYRRALAGRSLYVVSTEQEGLSTRLLADTEAIPCPADSPVLYRLEWKPTPATAPER